MSQSSETSTPVRVAVVGGGVAGVLLSIGLSKNPHLQVSLYEASRGFSQYGAGLNLGHNGVRALEAIDPKCFQGYKQHETTGILPGHKQVYQRLSEATGPNAGQVFLEVTSDIGQSTVHRARFLEEMVTLLPAGIAEFGKCLKHIENRGVDGVTLKFEDGTTADHDVLLGADGPNSGTRIHILGADHPAAHPVYSGMCDFRNLLPMDRALEAVGEELAKSKMIECGHGGYALHYPISHGEIVNVGLVTYHYKEWKGPWRRSATKDEMLKVFDGWGGNVEALIKAFDKPTLWAVGDYPPAPTYYKSHVAVLGDGAHSSTPHQGQGANQAIEDALVLGRLFQHVKAPQQIIPALAAYDEVRRPRTQNVVTTSREAGLLFSFQHPEAGDDVEKVAELTRDRWRWMWDVDLERQNADALALFDKKCAEAGLITSVYD